MYPRIPEAATAPQNEDKPGPGPKYNCLEYRDKMNPQFNAIKANKMLIVISGFHIGWGLYFITPKSGVETKSFGIVPVLTSFYLGAIIGNLVVSRLIKVYEKRRIYIAILILFQCASITLIFKSDQYVCLIIARFIFGLGHGCLYITTIIQAGEIAVNDVRGMLLASFHQRLGGSFLITVLTLTLDEIMFVEFEFTVFAISILLVIYGFYALVYIFFYYIESPVFYIKTDRHNDALNSMIKLRNENCDTWEIKHDFTDLKTMVVEDGLVSNSIWRDGNWRPLTIVGLSVTLNVLAYNYMLNNLRLDSIRNDLELKNVTPWLVFFVRCTIGNLISTFIDLLNRRTVQIFSGCIAGLNLIGMGILRVMAIDGSHWITIIGFAVYEVFGLVGIGAISVIIAAEAFPSSKKSESLSIIFSCECTLHILFIMLSNYVTESLNVYTVFGFATAILMMTSVLYWIMPETRLLPLREARALYRKTWKMSI